MRPAFSAPSILSIVAAIWSFFAGPAGGLVLAVLAIVLGIIGVLLSVLPGRRGGLLSALSVILGMIGIVAAIFKLIAALL